MASQEQSKKPDTKSYRGTWEKASGTASYNSAPNIPVSDVTDNMIQTLRSASAVKENRDRRRAAVISDITKFLYHEYKDIDSCVRWAILHQAVAKQIDEDDETAQDNAPALLVQAIADKESYLAFEALNSADSTLRTECKSRREDPGWASQVPDHSKFGKDLKESPFFHAVHSSRNTAAVQSMVHSLDLYCKEQVKVEPEKRRALLQRTTSSQDADAGAQKDPDTARDLLLTVLQGRFRIVNKRYTALELASQEEAEQSGNLGVLEVLLQHSGITDTSFDRTFEDAMEGGRVEVIKAILRVEELRGKFVTSDNITKAMDNIAEGLDGDSDIPDIKDRRAKVLHELLTRSNNLPEAPGKPRPSSVFNNQVAQKIIELNLEEAWDKRPDDALLDETCLLHIAVYHQHVNFVERFLKDYPASVSRKALVPGTKMPKKPANKNSSDKTGEEQPDHQGYYPLWYNRKKWDGTEWVDREPGPNKSIRQKLVPATIRQEEKMQRLSSIFRESQVDELCFEISQFNSKLYRVSEFVHSLINHKENAGLLWYESTLKYARFPPLDVHIHDKEALGRAAREEHTEVFDILDWLRDKKQVNSIIELKVPDRLVNPHNELFIARYVDHFAIEILDWRFLDMSLSVFSANSVKPRIRELHLYSSGKRAAISHWFSEEGLITFPNLRNLRIHVIQELMSKRHCVDTVEHINSKLREFEIRWASMRAEVERKAREEKGKTDEEKNMEAKQETQRAAERRKAQKAILKELRDSGRKDLLKTGVNSQLWNPTHERLASLDELAQRAFPKISGFIRNYRNYVLPIPHVDSKDKDPEPGAGDSTKYRKRRRFRPTKVAIIDNGILSMSPVPIERPLGSRALEEFNKSNTKTNATTKANENDNNPKEKERNATKTAASRIGTPRHQTNGTRAVKTGLPNGAVNGGFLTHEAGAVASGKTSSTNNAAAAAHQETEDEDRRATKGGNRIKGNGTLWSRIKEGQSFVDDDCRVSPWLFASDAHGTQMANLICSIDPTCELYVAKVTDGNNFGTSPERVIRAIDWAITRRVDIISMSFTMFEHREKLEGVIRKAKDQGIVMMCSNHDEGANTKTSYPADYRETWVVTACDEYGFAPRERDPPKGPGNYMFQGLNVAAGVIHFLESNDRISGSSVATAIASGISSLILSCARLNTCNPAKDWHGESCPGSCARLDACRPAWNIHDGSCPVSRGTGCVAQTQDCDGENRRHIVSHFLKRMMPERSKAEGYVLLEKFGEIDAKVKEGDEIFADEVLRNWFPPEKLKDIIRVARQAKGP